MTKRKDYLLAAAALLCLSGTSLLTSCQKDYDGQLEILRNQINNGEVNLNGLKEKVTLIEQQIKALEEALTEGGSGHKEDIDRLKTELETVKTDLNNRIAELQAVIDCKKRSRLLQQKRRCCYSSDVAKLMFSS